MKKHQKLDGLPDFSVLNLRYENGGALEFNLLGMEKVCTYYRRDREEILKVEAAINQLLFVYYLDHLKQGGDRDRAMETLIASVDSSAESGSGAETVH